MSSSEDKDDRRASAAAPGLADTFLAVGADKLATLSAAASDIPTIASPPGGGGTLPELRPPLAPGDIGACGGYRVRRLLGRGGMGAVYEAIDTALKRSVALKLMLPALASSEEGRQRFLREARAAAAVHHENVVSVYAVGEDNGVPFLTMELLRGDHLGHLLGQDVSYAEVIRIGREVARGLAAAHALGVIHRDIKPANIWIEEGTAKVRLLDFGLARVGDDVSAVARGGPSGAPHLTQAGAMIGTLLYMAPEQVAGDHIDARSDLFALGVVLYQMASGQVPFNGTTLGEIASAIRRGSFTPLRQVAPGVPPDLARLVHQLLAPNPADRPQRALDVADELMAIGTQLLLSTGSTAVVVPVPARAAAPTFDFDPEEEPAPRRRVESPAMFLLGTAAVLLALVLLGSFGAKLATPTPVPKVPVEVVKSVPTVVSRPLSAPFAPLFNGRDLTGWRPAPGSTADAWQMRDGVLAGTPKPAVDYILFTDAVYADFELKLEYRWPAHGGHTVVLLRAPDDNPMAKGLALNIGDDEGFPDVWKRPIGAYYRTGTFQGVTTNPPAANRPIGQWNELQVVAKKNSLQVTLNRVPMPPADLSTAKPGARSECSRPAGPVGLVCHWGAIEFRNVALRPLTD